MRVARWLARDRMLHARAQHQPAADTAPLVTIELLDDRWRPAVRSFLEAREDATVFHAPEWADVIRASYGHETRYWIARQGSGIAGVFPVTAMRAPLLGRKDVATAYQMHSGVPLTDTESTAEALVRRAIDDATSAGAKYLEIRHYEASPLLESMGLQPVESGLCTTAVPLPPDLQKVRRNHRRGVRSAEERGLALQTSGSIEDLKSFREMYRREGRSLGAPQAGWTFFERLHSLAGASYRLHLARFEGRLIGGLLAVGDSHMEFARLSAYSSKEALSLNVGTALYWHAIQDAGQRGCATFSCGLSWIRDEGLIHWKEGWNGVTRPVHLYVQPIRSAAPAPGSYFEGYGLAKAVWKRLPLPVVDVIGHHVTRWIG